METAITIVTNDINLVTCGGKGYCFETFVKH